MDHQKSDLLIDSAYMCALIIVLFLFLFSFYGSSQRLFCISPGPEGDVDSLVLKKAFDATGGALLSIGIFFLLLLAAIIVHELGHLIGGVIKGYRPAHFCVFGIVLSLKGKRSFSYDPSARFGGYTVMCTGDIKRSPLLLIRMGPLFECAFFLAVSIFVAGVDADVTGIFLLGEIIAYLFVRTVSSGHAVGDDSATAAEVLAEGPKDYNKLMNVYDGILLGKEAKAKGVIPHDGILLGEEAKAKGVIPRNGSLTIKEELLMYGREE